jgi:hypothetical protein
MWEIAAPIIGFCPPYKTRPHDLRDRHGSMGRGGRQHHVRKMQRVPSAVLTDCAMRNPILLSISHRVNYTQVEQLRETLALCVPSAYNLEGEQSV